MHIFFENMVWMSWNVFLALLGLLFAYCFAATTKTSHKLWWALLWLLFLPNTVYLLTDLKHLVEQWPRVGESIRSLLLIQFGALSLIGISTYIAGLEIFERGLLAWLRRSNFKKTYLAQVFARYPNRFLVGFNFVVAFGVVMGRVMRTNSWYVFTQPLRVLEDGVAVLTSAELLLLTLAFGLVVNSVWWLAKLVRQ